VIRIGVVGHLARADHARTLTKTVNADYLSLDDGTLGCDNNHHHVAAFLAELPSTWSVILEDDAQPVAQFTTQLSAALPMSPSPIVSLYLGRSRPPHWQSRIRHALAAITDESWLISTHLLHAVGYAIRTDLLPSLLSHSSTLPSDQHISSWAKRFGHTIAYSVPSLIDHADMPTLVNHPDGAPRRKGRTAWTVGTREHWTTHTATI
jgi:hypothetical protein